MLVKSFSYHLPFGSKEAYRKEITDANLDKLARLIRICGFLTQTKAYLFWGRQNKNWLFAEHLSAASVLL
jgi:uncharacterized protein with PIN domain